MLNITPKFPKKVQFLLGLDFPLIDQLVSRKGFVGGRMGYPKQELFFWLLFKKSMGLDYRTVASMVGVCHSTLIRVNCRFSKAGIYQKFLIFLVKQAYKIDAETGVLITLIVKIEYIAKKLKAKASIPIKDTNQKKQSKARQRLTTEERIKGGYLN